MRRKFYVASMVIACLLGVTSCKEENPGENVGGEAPVTFNLGTVKTNGIDALAVEENINKLVYAVYDAQGNPVSGIQQVEKTNVVFPTSETITLQQGKTYKIVFWAQDGACTAYTTDDLRNVAIDYNGVNNDASRNAYYAARDLIVTQAEKIDLNFVRPFAQINVGMAKNDFELAKEKGMEIAQSAVEIESAASQIDLLTGMVSGVEPVSYTAAALPEELLKVDTNNDGMYDKEYVYLSKSYILVAEPTTGSEKTSASSFSVQLTTASGQNLMPIENYQNLPLQRAWRTNVTDVTLDGANQLVVTSDQAYEGNIIYTEYDQLVNDFLAGGTITLSKDMIFNDQASFVIPEGTEVVLDMNNHKFINSVVDNASILNYGKLTIKNGIFDNLAPITEGRTWQSVIKNSGELIIEGGQFGSDATCGNAIENRLGTTIINGGTFTCVSRAEHPEVFAYVFNNRASGGDIVINNATVTTEANGMFANTSNGAVIVNGGKFEKKGGCDNYYMAYATDGAIYLNAGDYTWFKGVSSKAIYTSGNGKVYVSDACTLAGDDGWTSITPNAALIQSKLPTALSNALEGSADLIVLTDNIEGDVTTTSVAGGNAGALVDGKILDGNGYTININTPKQSTHDCVFFTKGGTIKNVTIGGQFRGIYMTNLTSDLYLDNVVLDNVGYTFNNNTSNCTKNIIVTNSTLNGWTSYGSGDYEVSFTNCKFGKGTGAWSYAYIRPYTTTTLTNCNFETGFILDMSALESADKTLTITNCTLNGVPLTASNIVTMLEEGNSLSKIIFQ